MPSGPSLVPVGVLEPQPGRHCILDGVKGTVDVGRCGRDRGGGADTPHGARPTMGKGKEDEQSKFIVLGKLPFSSFYLATFATTPPPPPLPPSLDEDGPREDPPRLPPTLPEPTPP